MDSTNSKPFWQSKTIWANLLGVAATMFGPQAGLHVDAETTSLIFGIGNLVLRFLTDKSILS